MHNIVRRTALAAIAAALPIALAVSSFAQYSATPDPAPPQVSAPGQLPSQPQTPDQAQPAQPPQPDPPALVARIGHVQGNVSFMASGSSDWSAGVNNYPMIGGDRLFSDNQSQAEIATGATDVRLWQNTDVTLTNLTDQYEQIGLATGSIRVRVYSINPGATVEVDTPNGAAVITQPGDYRFDVSAGNGNSDPSSDAILNSGALQIVGPNGLNQQIHAGQAVQMTGTNQIQLAFMSLPTFDALDQWSIDRDHDVLNSQSAQYVNPETPGSSDLDANGTWTSTDDYGPVWTPTTVAASWTPYSVGYWAYVSPWGYTWIDAAPWGYAPFHYGRWVVYNGRWGWVPGPRPIAPVYSPALVAWVGGPHGTVGYGVGVAAWFPLGVGEPFVPWYHASPYYTRRVNVTNVNITNIHNTTVVNNYNNFIANTRTVSNVNQLNTSNLQYANRTRVTAVPETAMTSGRPVAHSTVRLTPAVQQQLATAPVHYAPSAAAPQQSFSSPRASVNAPVARPTLVTTHGYAQATPAANPAHPQSAETRMATNPSRAQYQPQPYSSTTYNHSQQSAPRPQAQQQPKAQKAPKPPPRPANDEKQKK
jgi:hypothetical protein